MILQPSAIGSGRVKKIAGTFDWVLAALALGIAGLGIFNLYSASVVLTQPLHITQTLWITVGVLFLAAPAAIIDYRIYERWAYLIYGSLVFMVFLVLGFGSEFNGSRRWLDLGLFNFQPSEPMKLGIIIMMARYFSTHEKRDGYSLNDLAVPFALVALPMFLIFKEPDLGTALLLLLLALSIAFFEGLKTSTIVIMVVGAIALTPILWFSMKDYQKNRVLTFLQIEEDPYGKDWQVKNSVIAVGAGGLTGKGYQQGTQIQKGFVPEPENDFALANLAEEQGFIGATGLLLLYLSLILWALRIAKLARDRFGVILAFGVAILIFWQVIINVGMVLRWMPVVGITLPLVSYGGSSVMTILAGIGLLMNVSIRRHVYKG